VSATIQSTNAVLNRTVPLDESHPSSAPLLKNLQGNVLRGHGRDHSVHVFFSFRKDAPARTILKGLAATFVTSAYAQFRAAERYHRFKVPGALFGNLFLTARGYERLGLEVDTHALFPEPDDLPDPHRLDSGFAAGMRAHAAKELGDPPPEAWDRAFQQELHAMLLLADDDEHELMRRTGQVLDILDPGCEVHAVESGHVIRNAANQGIEHFGFVDGRSQPLYLASDFNPQRTADAAGESIRAWDPLEPLGRVLVPDPLVKDQGDCFGSYLVFRKLEQDVRGFRSGLAGLAAQLGLTGAEAGRASALVVGRFEDGTPLAMQKEDGWQPAIPNDFDYKADPQGARCPLHAHIRKVNPRGHSVRAGEPADTERIRRITRRGIPYGEHVPISRPLEELPSRDVGVLFMCFQASIRRQFAFMQREWCNLPWFPKAYVGADALVGQSARPADHTHEWPTTYNVDATRPASFAEFVRMRGGEYFFAPSLPFFASLPED
jgi:Dyp-type peroxidase family